MLDRLDELIVAVASPPGTSPLGIVRLSGPGAIRTVLATAKTDTVGPCPTDRRPRRVSGEIFLDDERAVPAALYLFQPPGSYTRQEMVEIHTIGSPAVLELVRRRLIDLGALAAQPGEFTARRVLSGAIDFTAARAVAAAIAARTDTQLRAARRMMEGRVARQVNDISEALASLLALVEADIDFSQEPIDFITPENLCNRLAPLHEQLSRLRIQADAAERFDVLPHILLLGPPNVGKSSLMNRLSGTSRAICAAAAGTTRDILAAPITLGRREAVLLDAAGVDRSDDEILAQARARTVATAEQVDCLCVVVDLTHPDLDAILDLPAAAKETPTVIAANKADLITAARADKVAARLSGLQPGTVCVVSARDGRGIDALRDALLDALGAAAGTTTAAAAVLLSRDQRVAVAEAAEAVGRARDLGRGAAETMDCADLVAFELREALDALGRVVGTVTTDDLLARVFADFCIGK